jgi:AmmeMemoRadiSam system protein B
MIREAVFAGTWYPGTRAELERFIREATPSGEKAPALAVVAPHAGYRYSGAIAAETYARVTVPASAIVLCPNHRVPPPVLAVWARGGWRTPLGLAAVDEALAALLIEEARPLLRADTFPHEKEHAVELQLPFLQFHNPEIQIVPIVVATDRAEELEALGEAVARAIARHARPTLVVASSDMNHHESAAVTEEKDRLALARLLALDARGLLETVDANAITMCGVRPAAVAIQAALAGSAARGARPRAELVRHGHSGETTGDRASVVGYAGVTIR